MFFAMALISSFTVFAVDKDVVAKRRTVTKKSASSLAARTNALENQIRILQSRIDQMQGKSSKDKGDMSTVMEMYAHGPAIVASPAFLLRGPDSHELMVNLSGINNDLLLLKLRQKLDNYAKENSINIPGGPVIALSGGVEGRLVYNGQDAYSTTSRTDVNLSRAELDVIAEAGPWATAAMIASYVDNDTTSSGGSIARSNNSRLKIDRGWLTFGQLEKCPVYFSIGQLYASFGSYASYMVTTPSTQLLGRVKDRMAILGYDQFGLYAQIYGMAGETKRANNATEESGWSKIYKHGGVDVGYRKQITDNVKIHIGGGVLGNLAESQGMQDIFGASGAPYQERIKSHVLGYNGHVKFDFYNFDLLAEYIGASKAFEQYDLMFNNQGAKPQALNAQAAYSFRIKNKLSTLFVGYEATRQALALGLPKQSYFAGYSLALLKNVLASIEYRHKVNYNWNDTAGSTCGSVLAANTAVSGRHSNTVTMQLGAYF